MTTERLLHNTRHTEREAIEERIQKYRVWIAIIERMDRIIESMNRITDTYGYIYERNNVFVLCLMEIRLYLSIILPAKERKVQKKEEKHANQKRKSNP
jgi:hypothetical protein